MVATEVIPELLSSDGFKVGMGGEVGLPKTVLPPSAVGDHITPSHGHCTRQCATHTPRYAANLQRPWDQQSGQRLGDGPS
jgi:hypothetical protein